MKLSEYVEQLVLISDQLYEYRMCPYCIKDFGNLLIQIFKDLELPIENISKNPFKSHNQLRRLILKDKELSAKTKLKLLTKI